MLEKSKLKKLKNLQLQGVAERICNRVVESKIEMELSHPLFLKMQEVTLSFEKSQTKIYRNNYDAQVMAAEQMMKQTYRSFYQQLVWKASDLNQTVAQPAKMLLKKLDYTASAFERLKQDDKLTELLILIRLLRFPDFSYLVPITVAPEMIEQLSACYEDLENNINQRDSEKRAIRETPTSSKQRTPLINAICTYYLHLHLENETKADVELVNLMGIIKYIVDHGGTCKYTFKTRKPAVPKVKKRKKKKPLL